jgi:hypothetical protein
MFRDMAIRLFISMLTLFVLSHGLAGQEPEQQEQVRLVMVDGMVLVGFVVSESGDSVAFRTSSGLEITLRRSQIREMVPFDIEGFTRTDPNMSRLLFAPTGRSLEKGSGYFSDYWLFFPFIAIGPGGGLSLSGGTSLLPGTIGKLIYFAPKITFFERESSAIAAGLLAVGFPGLEEDLEEDLDPIGLVYGVGTAGSATRSLSVGLAFGWAGGEFSSKPAIMIGGHYQLSNSVALVSENYVLPIVDAGAIVSGGVRFFGDRISADIALATLTSIIDDSEVLPILPWVGFTYNFGPK